MVSSKLPRRSVLQASLLSGMIHLAGCLGKGNRLAGRSGEATPTQTGVFESISFEGQDLVVHLQADHGVSQVNLIAPDGTAFAEQPVATGATTVRIQILDIRLGGGGYEHYEPGKYELVAKSEGNTESIPLALKPDLQVVNIRQYRDGDSALDLGRLEVDIENVGSGPTWVYDITYRNSPNWTENDELVDNPGVPYVGLVDNGTELVIPPHGNRRFVGASTPFLFIEKEEAVCRGSTEMTVVIGTAVGDPLEQRVKATARGKAYSTALPGDFTCEEIAVEMIGEEETNE